ncbi:MULTISPECIES: hypothetical protein [Fischerella]|uniref:hypothetical protein n=1 Tax=Fischerella TaxID=1190 RepID=UPI0003196E4E|nr:MULTISPECIES: hypothetical protein [Fischerella]MBD2431408.1 hypothetical protein [Fischerella sp. FACHB-380]
MADKFAHNFLAHNLWKRSPPPLSSLASSATVRFNSHTHLPKRDRSVISHLK